MSEAIIEPSTTNCLEVVPIFKDLPQHAIDHLCNVITTRSLAADEILFQQGDPGASLFIVESGRVKISTTSLDGSELVLDIIGPRHVLGELALLDGKPRSATAQALEATHLLELTREPFLQHLYDHPETAVHLLAYISGHLRQRVSMAEQIMVANSPARLANALLFLAERDGQVERGLITSTLSKKDLAATIGTSEDWVSRMLEQWGRDGIIGMTGTRRLLLHDVDALYELAHPRSDAP